MSKNGKIITMSGVATTTETALSLPQTYRRGAYNSNGTAPNPPKRTGFVSNVRIANLDPTNNLIVRLNGGAVVTLRPNNLPYEMDAGEVTSISVAASAATVAWDLTAIGSS